MISEGGELPSSALYSYEGQSEGVLTFFCSLLGF